MYPRDHRRLTLSFFLWGSGEGLFLYLLPLYIRSLGGSAAAVGLVYAVQFAVAALSILLAGPAVDRFGHVVLIRFAAMIALPGVVIWTLAPHWQWIIPGMVFYAVSFSVIPALNGYVGAMHDDHVGAFGSTFAYFSLGMIVTPGLGGFIAAQLHSIRPVFALTCMAELLAMAVIWKLTPRHAEGGAPLTGAIRAIGSSRTLQALCLYMVALLFVMSITSSFVGPYLQDVDHASDAVVGLLGSCIALGEFLMGLALGRVNARLGRVYTLLSLQGALGLSLLVVLAVHWVPVLALAFVLRGAIITSSTMGSAFVGGVLPPQQLGAGYGLMGMSSQVGMMLGAYTGGILYGGGPTRPFLVSLALLLVIAILTRAIAPLFAERRAAIPTGELPAAR